MTCEVAQTNSLGREESSFDLKKSIIGHNLYGVDVMEWACHVAELRLWLALIIDADFPHAELHLRDEPLLPHFSFNIRPGDSLVQEIGGMNLAQIRANFSGVPPALKARVTRLSTEKLKFFNNDDTCRYRSEKELEHAELQLFRELVDTHTKDIKQQIDDLRQLIDGPKERQMLLDGTIEERVARQLELQAMEWQEQIDALTQNHDRLTEARDALVDVKDVPFVWDIAFVEIFTGEISGEKRGFDIVIGNPPYVRQENISDPTLSREKRTTANKKAYKAKLARSVYQAFPRFFGYRREKDKPDNPSAAVAHKLDAKSDLYIYFYFHGLSLLNPKGTFCFITSNSWLDVNYGKDLQEFTLKHCHIKQIIDNQVRRSFASADVNTVISLFSAPDQKGDSRLDHTARFVTFTTPFEGVLDAVIFEEVEEATQRRTTPEHRIFPITQSALLESGCDTQAKYTGDKWGGKYLRAPDIYWTILEKGKDKLVRLRDVAKVRRGFTTGANDFFYLNAEQIKEWEIEDEFLKPVIKSPRECKSILIDPSQLKFKLFMCGKDKADLAGTTALEYIEWGESQEFHKGSTCQNRRRWWSGSVETGNSIFVKEANDTSAVFYNPDDYLVDCRLYYANLPTDIFLFLNSAIGVMFFELYNRAGLGEGARSMMVSDYEQVPILVNANINEEAAVLEQISSLSPRKYVNFESEWLALDTQIFDALNLTQGERDGVYEAVVGLVEARLQKAQSLRG